MDFRSVSIRVFPCPPWLMKESFTEVLPRDAFPSECVPIRLAQTCNHIFTHPFPPAIVFYFNFRVFQASQVVFRQSDFECSRLAND